MVVSGVARERTRRPGPLPGQPCRCGQFPMVRTRPGVTLLRGRPERARRWGSTDARSQEEDGSQEPWNPNGTLAGRCTVATGGPPNDVASRITRSEVPLPAS